MKRLSLLLIGLFVLNSIAFASFWTQTKPQFIRNLPSDVGLVNGQDVWVDLPAASTSTVLDIAISTQTLVANTTTYTLALGELTDVIFPRNIVADTYFASGESTTTVSGLLTVTGYDQFGRVKTEALTISTNTATGAVAWSSITSLAYTGFTISGASEANTTLSVGMGTKIALSNNIGDTDDLIKVIETGVTSTTYTANATYDTIIFADAPDATSDYYVYYEARTDKTRYVY